ncbi:uncharacterized protein LOC129908551 [Episyrphus balteatus]|uniref:uncharacterized protein LOC129908551 n=1 Tax=Episyrphus balteatus TaxID=286459 RepID=UPI002486BD4A|nr:uncharacterized protein LOC129908551 [Episyrphus balteatus]
MKSEMNIMEGEEKRPVPMPRRFIPEPRKNEYENVTIDIIDKNLNINSDNIQAIGVIDKCPNNKVFHVPDSNTTEIPQDTSIEINNFNEKEDENQNIPEPVKQPQIIESTTPIPAPRKSQSSENDIVTNEAYENVPPFPHHRPTGATSKETPVKRRAPDIPPKTYLDVMSPSARYSIGSESSFASEMNESIFEISKSMKSSSSTTLNSSMEDSATGSSENSKFKSPRPGYVPPLPPTHSSELSDSSDPNDLLKSIGTTSKLLTESISERVAMKAKGAKHKLDKNFKTSQDLINNLSADASCRLKNVGKKINTIGNNFTLTKKDKKKTPATAEFDPERPQTVPPNDPVFKSISFSSPMNKTNGVVDLTTNGDVVDDGSYEVPRSIKVQSLNEDYPCPSYEDAIGSSATPTTFPRNTNSSKSLILPRNSAELPGNSETSKQLSNPNLTNDSDRSSAELSRPMPKFPPPPPPISSSSSSHSKDEVIYGKLKPIAPPTRQKRRKNYEAIELRRVEEIPSSVRATVDSTEIRIREEEEASRLESIRLKEIIRLEEAATPKPDRSESWEYHEEQEDADSSSPEPLYANHEATYGKLFEMESSSNDLLTPQMRKLNISSGNRPSVSSYRMSRQPAAVKDVLNEFDPLMLNHQSSSIGESNKSNQLLLLEHMLQEETYGRIPSSQQSADEQSICTSEEDNSNVASTSAGAAGSSAEACLATSPKKANIRTTPPTTPTTPTSKVQIIHQNPNLRSDSMENIVEECEVQSYLSSVDENEPSTTVPDLARPSQKQTNWFVNDEKSSPKMRENPFDKLQHFDGESPPTYLEAISGSDSKSSSSYSPAELKSRTAKFSKNMLSSMKIRVDALKRKTSFRASRSMDVKVPITMIPRPSLSPYLVRYEGPLIRFPSGVVEDILKEIQNRKAILRDKQFQTFLDSEMKNPKEIIPLENITTLQCVSNSRVTDNSTHFYCFELTTSIPKNQSSQMQMTNPNVIMSSGTSGNCKMSRVCHLYGVGKESERSVWMQKIMESLTNVFPAKYTCNYYRAGWCYLKNSITSEWSGTWLLLKKNKRHLIFVSESNTNIEKMDLRKARCIVLKENDESIENLHVERGPILMIDCPPYTVYMIMTSGRETKIWRHIIREVAHNNGSTLNEQQLTKFDVPVLVDKCINFVYIHGSMSEGIYRKSGSENSILKLLSQFRADAFNVEITRNEFNEHDVANALKRFMRDLPVRLLGKTSESFIAITALDSVQTKIESYKELLSRLHVIERETLKKIIGHLAFINSQKQKNKMGVNNLAMIWGPTLLQNAVEEMTYSQKEADVIVDLVNLYKHLFPFTEDEIKREQEMLVCLQKYYSAAETFTDAVKKSGDLKMWITLHNNSNTTSETEEKDQVNVTITPTKTAYEICQELAPKMNASTHEVTLYEVILNGNLERPLHHDTKVFDAVLNWSYWPEEDRKHNNLVLKPIDMLKDVQRAVKNLATVTPGKELKFADNKTKSLKWYHVELRDGKIVILKREKNGALTIVREIFLHSVTAYLGCEKKRDSQWTWAITFVESNKKQILRSRDSPFIGHVIAGSEWVDKTIWFSSIWYSLYGESILPPAEIIMK